MFDSIAEFADLMVGNRQIVACLESSRVQNQYPFEIFHAEDLSVRTAQQRAEPRHGWRHRGIRCQRRLVMLARPTEPALSVQG